MVGNRDNKNGLLLNLNSSSFKSIDKFLDSLKSNGVEVKALGRDEYVVKL